MKMNIGRIIKTVSLLAIGIVIGIMIEMFIQPIPIKEKAKEKVIGEVWEQLGVWKPIDVKSKKVVKAKTKGIWSLDKKGVWHLHK